MSLNGQSVSGGYDALGRQTSETGALGTVRYQYDAAGRRTQLTYPDGFYVTYGYDAASELTTIKDNTGFTLATYAWDNYGRRGSLTLGNGATTSYTYDNYSNLALLNVNLPSGQNQAISLGYNPAGQIKSRSASNDAYAYTGAAASSNAYTLNGRNQIAVSGPSTFSYDGRGNLTNDGVNTYAYDIANRLTTVGSVSLSYDPLSRLAKTAGSATTQFAYDGSEIIAEYNSAGAEQSRYVRGPGNDQPIVWYNVAGGARYWLQANPQGSIIAVTGDNGAAAAINTYDDYGLPGGGNFGRFQYTGQAWIPEIRLYDYKSRIYSPNLGRFLQSDPIGYGDGLNFYNAMHSDPVNLIDPTGTATPTCKDGGAPLQGKCSDNSTPDCGSDATYNPDTNKCDDNIVVTAEKTKDNSFFGLLSQVLMCASDKANQWSIPGVLGVSKDNGLAYGLAGNIFSGIVDAGSHLGSTLRRGYYGNTKGAIERGLDTTQDALMGGATQGLPGATNIFGQGLAGITQDTAAGASATLLGLAEGTAVATVAQVKIAYDAGTFLGALVICGVSQ